MLAQRNAVRGVPPRARVFARIALLSRVTSPFGALANFAARQKTLRALMQRIAGIAAERPLPAFAPQSFLAWWKAREALPPLVAHRPVHAPRGEAVLFHDTFTDYYNPEVGKAAVRILEALGYRVVVVPKTSCCGRPAVSKGLLPLAKTWARQNVEALLPYARRNVPIVGTEPSCLLTFRDEYPDLLQDDAARAVAAQAVLLDELIAGLAKEEPEAVKAAFRDDLSCEVLLHAHCHQKAIIGPEPTLEALRLVPGYKVSLVETSCCGMAGSFGFEAEHYDVSRAMGGLRLFPAVEAAAADTAIAITGVSCRQQIGHFTSRTPRHALEILADALR
jgi:Fe-S oxidoreductase